MAQARAHDNLYWYLNEVSSRVVANSGIPTDRSHIGKLVLQGFRDDLDFIAQIDGGTGESETNGSLLKRSIQCAISFRKMGLKPGDVLVLMAPNHLDLAVPFYAAMYLGVVIAPVDMSLKVGELEHTFDIYKPSIVMSHSKKTSEIRAALETLNINARIVTFDEQNHGSCLADLLTAGDDEIDNFKAEDFNAEDSIATILPTSGSTGLAKGAALTYKTLMITAPHWWLMFVKFPSPTRLQLVLAPLQWTTATCHFVMSPFLKYTRLQTSASVTVDHLRYLINTYKPTSVFLSPRAVTSLLKSVDNGGCDMSCFDIIFVGSSPVEVNMLERIKTITPKTAVVTAYGMTELSTVAFQGHCHMGSCGKPSGIYQYRASTPTTAVEDACGVAELSRLAFQGDSRMAPCGKPSGIYQYRLIHLDTQEDIEEPNVNGELWIKGPMLKEFYNNPKETEETFAEDGWFKTGDMFYRDKHWNFYFVERIKILIDYDLSRMISPTEIEVVIRAHPNVMDVVVIAVPDPVCTELPAACVIPEPGCSISAQEIKDLVKEELADFKQLRGGVAFMSSFPLTPTAKINRRKLNDMIKDIKFE